jgi:heptosyltransferase-1
MRDELGLPVAVLGGPGDREAAALIAADAAGAAVALAGRTSLLEAAALIERSRALVGVDTGLGHMGIAFKRPTLLLFGSTCPYTDTGRAEARVLYHAMECSPCKRRPTCGGVYHCMRAIGVDDVMGALRTLPGVCG